MNRKYRILIADDEYWVRKKLAALLDWESFGLECLEPAKDGLETLERVREEQPDILVTDVNMPFLNGVELLEKVHQEQPGIVSFVISGYDDFEYVRGSFLSGSTNYLLKPVSRKDMEAAVSKALEIISVREDRDRKVSKAASLLRDTEFSQLVRDRETTALPTGSMDKYLGMEKMSLMLIKIHNLQTVTRQYGYDMSLYSFSLKRDLLALAGREDLILFNHIYRPGEFMLLSELDESGRKALAIKIQHYFTQYPDAYLTIAMTGNNYSIERVNAAYREAVSVLLSRKFGKTHQILTERRPVTEGIGRLEPDIVKQVQANLYSGNKHGVQRLLLEETGLAACDSWQYAQVMQLAKEIGMTLSKFAIRHRPESSVADMDALADNICRAVETLELQNIRDAVRTAVEYLLPGQQEMPADTTKQIVRQAAAYIDENYFEDLNLSVLAEKFRVESSYFSRMFRQEMGENLIFYITRKRIEKAQGLIAHSETNLTEIAFLVGYNDYSYFNRVFKKSTGMSPREYRNSLSPREVPE